LDEPELLVISPVPDQDIRGVGIHRSSPTPVIRAAPRQHEEEVVELGAPERQGDRLLAAIDERQPEQPLGTYLAPWWVNDNVSDDERALRAIGHHPIHQSRQPLNQFQEGLGRQNLISKDSFPDLVVSERDHEEAALGVFAEVEIIQVDEARLIEPAFHFFQGRFVQLQSPRAVPSFSKGEGVPILQNAESFRRKHAVAMREIPDPSLSGKDV
jgi:hypothetical protein